jgi:hypothetical protein
VPEIGRDRQRASVPARDHLRVDHPVARPDVGEQPTVVIPPLDVELEPHRRPGDQRAVEPHRRLTAAVARAPRAARARRVNDLRRVDADVAHALDAIGDPDVDGVAVVDVHHGGGEPARALRRGRPRRRERSQQRDEHAEDRGRA